MRVFADRNESPLAPPDFVIDAIRSLRPEQLQRYPVALLRDFESALADRLNVARAQLTTGSGADDVLFALARAFVRPGDNVVTTRPTFGMYAKIAELAGATNRAVPYARRWVFDPAALIAAADERTKLVIVGHPNNPTGEALRIEDALALADALPQSLIVVDEVYLSMTAASFGGEFLSGTSPRPNVVVLGSLSKVAALAGIRVGYAIAPDNVASTLGSAMGPFPIGVASLAAALAYVTGGAATQRFEYEVAAQVARSLDAIGAAVAPLSDGMWRGCANFVLMDFGDRADAFVAALAADGILVRRIADPELPGGVRISALDDDSTAALIASVTVCA